MSLITASEHSTKFSVSIGGISRNSIKINSSQRVYDDFFGYLWLKVKGIENDRFIGEIVDSNESLVEFKLENIVNPASKSILY